MKETLTMWRYTKMVVLTALTAAVYTALLIFFKGIPLIPGFTEIRVGTVIPVVFGILFGPAGAWGSALGYLHFQASWHGDSSHLSGCNRWNGCWPHSLFWPFTYPLCSIQTLSVSPDRYCSLTVPHDPPHGMSTGMTRK